MNAPAQPVADLLEEGLAPLPEVREYLGGISTATLYRIMGRKEIAWVRVGGRRMIPRAALRDYALRRMHEACR